MVLVINQKTFDDAVKENIEEFGMAPEEAISDTVKQFEVQGVDLSNIIKDSVLSNNGDTRVLSDSIKQLGKLVKSSSDVDISKCIELLTVIKSECDQGVPYQILAGKEGAYSVVLDVMLKYKDNNEACKMCLKALISLMTKQPDLLDDLGIKTMMNILDKQADSEIEKLLLKWVRECCVMHELNRQHIFEAAILDHLKPLLEKADSLLLRDVLAVLRALVLDDDVRVEFGRSHEHARAIASDTLHSITALLGKFKTDELLMSDLLLTLSSLLVRTEFCKKVEDAGGLEMIRDVMTLLQTNDKLIRQCFKVLKALAGNDEVKCHVVQQGMAPILISALDTHKKTASTATLGLACVTALTLRSPDNSKAFFEAGAPEVIVECMRVHSEEAMLQKNGSWAIRNMVSRSRYQNEKFLSLGIENILHNDLQKFPNHEYDIKSALRDLGCDVKLKEEWTGKGGLLTTQAVKK